MKLTKSLLLLPVGVICLASCNAAVRYDEKDYQLDLVWDTNHNYNILQLSDIHMSTLSDREVHYDFIRGTVQRAKDAIKEKIDAEGKIDLIVITGDVFTFADKTVAKDVFSFFDSFEIPWAVTWGNHDEQCYFPIEWLTGYLNDLNQKRLNGEKSFCVFKDLQDDDIYGNANYVINLREKDKLEANPIEQIFMFDSNRYNYGEYAGYDYIHYDQIDWYDRQIQFFNDKDNQIKSLAFFHIPFPEFEEKYQLALANEKGVIFVNDENLGVKRDHHEKGSTGDPKKNTHLYDHFVSSCKTNGVFIGHNHLSSYVVEIPEGENKITLGFGIKSTNRISSEEDMTGGQIISLDKSHNGDFKIYGITHKYGE